MTAHDLSLKQYYGRIKSIGGVLAALFALVPGLSAIVRDPVYGAYLFPPMGDSEGWMRLFSVVICVFGTFVVFLSYRKKTAGFLRPVLVLIGSAIILILCYLAAFYSFVRIIPWPARDTTIAVSVGYCRTDYAQQNFAGLTDIEMLRRRGPVEEEIRQLWTRDSVLLARSTLWLTYTFALTAMVSIFSIMALAGTKPRAAAPKIQGNASV